MVSHRTDNDNNEVNRASRILFVADTHMLLNFLQIALAKAIGEEGGDSERVVSPARYTPIARRYKKLTRARARAIIVVRLMSLPRSFAVSRMPVDRFSNRVK